MGGREWDGRFLFVVCLLVRTTQRRFKNKDRAQAIWKQEGSMFSSSHGAGHFEIWDVMVGMGGAKVSRYR